MNKNNCKGLLKQPIKQHNLRIFVQATLKGE